MTSKTQKTSKDSKGVSLACNPVEVAEPVVAHINSSSYSRRSNEHWKRKRCILLLRKRSGMLMTCMHDMAKQEKMHLSQIKRNRDSDI